MADPKLIDMAYSKAELKAQRSGAAISGPSDPYPWGLGLHLDKEQLDKLSIATLPEVGSEMHLLCVAKVTSVNHSARAGQDENCSVGLQITMMQVLLKESAAAEKGEKESPKSEAKETPSLLLSKYKE
jgi:hypothetical protein